MSSSEICVDGWRLIRNNDEYGAWGKADGKNLKNLELLLFKKNPLQNIEHGKNILGGLL
jgi:hypothetical protein